jgi:hypothetical protein
VANPNKDKGSQWERDIVAYFNANGFPHVERRYGAGNTLDKGDINGIQAVIEAKNLAKITLSSIMDETAREVSNSHFKLGIAIIKRRGKGAQGAYCVLSFDHLLSLLKDAGY